MVGKAVISTPKRQWQEYPQSKPVCESLSQKIQAKQKLFLIWHVSKMGCRLQSFQLMLQCFTVNTNKASSFSCKGFGWLVRKYHSCMWPQHMKRDTGSFAWLFYDLIFFRSFYIWISYTTYVIIDINICIYNQAYPLSIKCSEKNNSNRNVVFLTSSGGFQDLITSQTVTTTRRKKPLGLCNIPRHGVLKEFGLSCLSWLCNISYKQKNGDADRWAVDNVS